MSDFMQRQITGNQNWLRVETRCGTDFLPGDLCLFVRNSDQDLPEAKREEYKKAIWQYTEDEPQEWENIKGYGARLSAPGYLDCTEWTVFDSESEARAYLDEMYPEDEETGDPCPC
jgi:hypothetical protein